MFKRKLLVMLSLIGCLSINTAFAAHAAPEKCPNLSYNSSWTRTMNVDGLGLFVVQQSAAYDTSEQWTTGIGPINASTQDEAFQEATRLAADLTLMDGPTEETEDGNTMWMCLYYSSSQNVAGIAMTPPQTIPDKLMNFARKYRH